MEEMKNMLEQKNKFKWRDNPPVGLTREDMKAALDCAAHADEFGCDCWHTGCVYYGNCRACVVFHLCLKQLPTCQRDAFEGLEEVYLKATTGSTEVKTGKSE